MSDDMDEPGWHRADGVQPHYFRVESISAEMCADCGGGPTDPSHLDAKHLRPYPGLGQSRWLSTDHHLLAYRERYERAEAEAARLRAALEHIESMGNASHSVAGTPLAIYARAAILDRLKHDGGERPDRG